MSTRKVDRLDLSHAVKDRIHECYQLDLSNILFVRRHADSVFGDRMDPTLRRFLAMLSDKDCARALQLCLVLFYASNGRFLPRVLQLQAALPTLAGRDSIINAGTAAGKTICMALPALMHPENISLVISPLKRLMGAQAEDYRRLGLRAIHLNSDTADDPAIWKDVADGRYSIIIVSPESADTTPGTADCDSPRFSKIIQQTAFCRRVRNIFIDEGHHIFVDGAGAHGLGAFRPSYGRLSQLRVFCRQSTFQVLSGTLPPHFRSHIANNLHLKPNFATVSSSSNSPNLTYAALPLVGPLADFKNFDFVVGARSKGIIFVDDRTLAMRLATYLDNHEGWLPGQRGKGVARTYYGSHSLEHLETTFKSFNDPDGICRIIVATSGLSEGIDSAVVNWVVQAGLVSRVTDLRQRFGRAGRDRIMHCICILLYESWAMNIDITSFPTDSPDPDVPRKRLTKNSKKTERVGLAILELVCTHVCFREAFVEYFNDESLSRHEYTGFWCCNRGTHTDGWIDFGVWFTRAPRHESEAEAEHAAKALAKKIARKREKCRPKTGRPALMLKLLAWRSDEYERHPLRGFRTEEDILPQHHMKAIARIAPTSVSAEKITTTLEEASEWSREWAAKLEQVIREFDRPVRVGSGVAQHHSDESGSSDSESGSSDEEPLALRFSRSRADIRVSSSRSSSSSRTEILDS